jgi:polyhydroxyalkanoate synthesis repressor PhaR
MNDRLIIKNNKDVAGKSMHLIKKYANRKLYDTKDKRYLTMDRLAELIKSGAEVSIVDKETGDDLTSSIVSQLLAREDADNDRAVPSSVLMQLLRKGRGTLFGYGKKYVSLWQSALTMSKDEIEKLVNSLVKDKEISESEGKNLKKEIMGFANNLKAWIIENIDLRVSEGLKRMNLSSRDQVSQLTRRVDALARKVEELEEQNQQNRKET